VHKNLQQTLYGLDSTTIREAPTEDAPEQRLPTLIGFYLYNGIKTQQTHTFPQTRLNEFFRTNKITKNQIVFSFHVIEPKSHKQITQTHICWDRSPHL